MKVAEMNPYDDVFTSIGEDGTQTTYAVTAMNAYIEAHPDEVIKTKIPVEGRHVEQWLADGSVEPRRFQPLVQNVEWLVKPIVFVLNPDETVKLIDGRHRFALFHLMKQPQILAYVVTRELAQRFVLEDVPQMPQEVIFGPSFVDLARKIKASTDSVE